MAMFRKLQEDATPNSGHVIVDNFRPPQALGRRQVARSFDVNSASGQHLSLLTLFLVILCYIYVTGFICIWSYNKRLYRVLMMFIKLYDNILNPGIYQI